MMTREQLNEKHRAIIARNYRTMADRDGGTVPQRLLDDLYEVAEQHAIEVGAAVVVAEHTPSRRRAKAT